MAQKTVDILYMQQESNRTQVTELTREIENGVHFDSESVSLFGVYKDELSLFRAKRSWTEILETNFLLEAGYDYNLNKIANASESSFVLQCTFQTACGRYAFWRLTNDQAPEAQYMIETAHIPSCDFTSEMFLNAPDLKPLFKEQDELSLAQFTEQQIENTAGMVDKLKRLIDRISSLVK